MSSLDELITYIRFGLSTLPEKNGHHDFEHICRHLARARICHNILPAAGPVSAGGDQGRDFETFRTYIQDGTTHGFAGMLPGRRLAFACSLDAKPVPKCKADVGKIMATGARPDGIYFFSSQSIPTAKRHSLVTWAEKTHKVELEVIDGVAIAELLTGVDVFWIAARYLSVPVEVFPSTDEPSSEYAKLREKWFSAESPPKRFAEFIEIKRGSRHALDSSLQDMPEWLRLLDSYVREGASGIGVQQAKYEYIVLLMRSRRTFVGEEDRVRDFLSDIESADLPDLMEQLDTVASYATASRLLGAGNFSAEEAAAWHEAIIRVVESGIQNPASPNQLCRWLVIKGRTVRNEALRTGNSAEMAEAMESWDALVDVLPNAPLFPVKDFHEEVLETERLFGELVDLSALVERIRPHLGAGAGKGVVADSHFDRAIQLSKKGKTAAAIRELHAAKIKWMTDETLGQSAQCCLLLSRYYTDCGLNIAAIYFALASSYICVNADDDTLREHVHEGIHDAAESAYLQGHWSLFYELAMPAIALQSQMFPHGLDADQSPHLAWYLRNLPLALDATKKLAPTVFERAFAELSERGLEPSIRDGLNEAERKTNKCAPEIFLSALRKAFTGAPLEDCGEYCRATWSAHGIIWRFRWENSYESFRVAMEVVACIQVALADLGDIDLDIIPGEFEGFIETSDESKIQYTVEPSNERYIWRFSIPRSPVEGHADVQAFTGQIQTLILEILRSVSAMPSDRFVDVFRKNFTALGNSFFARRFPELLDFFGLQQRFGVVGRNEKVSISAETWIPEARTSIPWVETLHPEFEEKAELELVRRRYEIGGKATRFTMERLMSDNAFRSVVEELRSRGWKDWHVIMAVSNLAANFRVRAKFGDQVNDERFRDALWKEMTEPEEQDKAEIPATEFTVDKLEFMLFYAMMSGFASHGLSLQQGTPNKVGLFEYARTRWRYFDLDVEHARLK